MPDFQISGSATELATEDDLFDLLKELRAQGWKGTVGVGADGHGDDAPPVWSLNAFIADSESPTGSRTVKANVGDMRVVIGSVTTPMTQAAYAAAYGVAQ